MMKKNLVEVSYLDDSITYILNTLCLLDNG